MNGFFRGFIIFLSTGAFSGYAPVMPGTVGSVAGVALYFLLSSFSVPIYLLLTSLFISLSIWSSGKALQLFKEKDPPEVVIDEIAGYLVTMATFPPDWRYIFAGFILFRIMDILKPYPASWINDNVQGGLGIVLDDVVAGIYANLILQTVRVLM